MDLKILGWEKYSQSLKQNIDEQDVARVAVENRGGYLLIAKNGELEGIVQGKFRRAAKNESEFPKVGDWVEIEKLQGEDKAVIKEILPRLTKISRKRAGEDLAEQIIATNIDLVFIVQGLDGDFNLSRLERYVAMAKEGNCESVILLNKSDLANDGDEKVAEVENVLTGIKTFSVSAKIGTGIDEVRELIAEGLTVVFVGSSGAGKSTLVNMLLGSNQQKTNLIRLDDSRGRHTTTKREMIILPSGGILIDTPGMRELGLWASEESLNETFEDIEKFVGSCKFNDCDHEMSFGCAVIRAVEDGLISNDLYQRYLKLKKGLDLTGAKRSANFAQARRRFERSVVKRVEHKK